MSANGILQQPHGHMHYASRGKWTDVKCLSRGRCIVGELDATGAKRTRTDQRMAKRAMREWARDFPEEISGAAARPGRIPIWSTDRFALGFTHPGFALFDPKRVKSLKYYDNATRAYVLQFGKSLSGFKESTRRGRVLAILILISRWTSLDECKSFMFKELAKLSYKY